MSHVVAIIIHWYANATTTAYAQRTTHFEMAPPPNPSFASSSLGDSTVHTTCGQYYVFVATE